MAPALHPFNLFRSTSGRLLPSGRKNPLSETIRGSEVRLEHQHCLATRGVHREASAGDNIHTYQDISIWLWHDASYNFNRAFTRFKHQQCLVTFTFSITSASVQQHFLSINLSQSESLYQSFCYNGKAAARVPYCLTSYRSPICRPVTVNDCHHLTQFLSGLGE